MPNCNAMAPKPWHLCSCLGCNCRWHIPTKPRKCAYADLQAKARPGIAQARRASDCFSTPRSADTGADTESLRCAYPDRPSRPCHAFALMPPFRRAPQGCLQTACANRRGTAGPHPSIDARMLGRSPACRRQGWTGGGAFRPGWRGWPRRQPIAPEGSR